MATMTKGERHDLQQLVKKREKVMKASAVERSASLFAEFDAQCAKIYHYDDDAVWRELYTAAEEEVRRAQAAIAKRAKAKGIPAEFAPMLSFGWHGRGHNAVATRREELRRAAKGRIEQIEREAFTAIESLALSALTEIITSGLESAAAKAFLQDMPKWDVLMPPPPVAEMQALLDTRTKEQRRQLSYDVN